jgi:hypothetical protein
MQADLPVEVVELLEALDVELDGDDRMVRAMARRLATLSAGNGPASVAAIKALAGLVAAHREDGVPRSGRRRGA